MQVKGGVSDCETQSQVDSLIDQLLCIDLSFRGEVHHLIKAGEDGVILDSL